MKKLISSESMKTSVWCLALIVSFCMAGLTSCSEDDGIGSGAPYTGVWEAKHIIEEIDDEDDEDYGVYEEDIPSGLMKLNLKKDGTFVLTEEGDREEGEWFYSKEDQELTAEFDYGEILRFKVVTWTSNTLKTVHREGSDKTTIIWKK